MEDPVSVMTASSGTVTKSDRFPYLKATMAVMIFVVLAGFMRPVRSLW